MSIICLNKSGHIDIYECKDSVSEAIKLAVEFLVSGKLDEPNQFWCATAGFQLDTGGISYATGLCHELADQLGCSIIGDSFGTTIINCNH